MDNLLTAAVHEAVQGPAAICLGCLDDGAFVSVVELEDAFTSGFELHGAVS